MSSSIEFDPFEPEAKLDRILEMLRHLESDYRTTLPDLLFDVFLVVWDEDPDMLPKFLERINFLRTIPETDAEGCQHAAKGTMP
ncbi:hypothetical protein TomTYG75_05210 [Sphingobium sp. TomTYG75]